jgi:tetratricopeptide (TPR) repeat protein
MTFCNRRRARAASAVSLAVALAFLTGSLPSSRTPAAYAQGSGRAGALTDAQKKKVTEHYERANRYYLIGKYPEAIADFEAAYLIGADPVMIFNIAQSYRLNNQPEEAARFYRNYLRSAPEAKNRAEVEKKIAEMDKRASEKRQTAAVPAPVESPAPAPSPSVPAPVTPTAPVAGGGYPSPGPASGMPTQPPPWSPGTGAGTATSPPPAGEPAGTVATTAAAGERPSRVWPMVLMISGGVLVTTSLLLGGAAANKAKEVEKRANAMNLPFDGDTKKLETDGKAASAAAVVTGLVGLAAGAVGLVWWLRSAPQEGGASASAGSATSSVFPLAGPGLYGAGAQVTF